MLRARALLGTLVVVGVVYAIVVVATVVAVVAFLVVVVLSAVVAAAVVREAHIACSPPTFSAGADAFPFSSRLVCLPVLRQEAFGEVCQRMSVNSKLVSLERVWEQHLEWQQQQQQEQQRQAEELKQDQDSASVRCGTEESYLPK